MPTYQYSCTDCGHFFEIFQNFSDDSLTVCPQCEGRLRKVFNAVGVVFKGSGFYRNDSRGQQSGAEAPSTPKESGGSSEKAAAGSGTAASTEASKPSATSGSSSTASTPA